MESFSTFLSHKYDAPLVNEFFFRLFVPIADVQFEVDAGKSPTNVTRLERMVREVDAFIGIYPFEPVDIARPSPQSLEEGSQYFRLELDLATRAQKPGLIFTDSRYGKVLSAPSSISYETFNIREILAPGPKPSAPRFSQAIIGFCDRVKRASDFRLSERRFEKVTSQVGILVPLNDGADSYGREHVELLRNGIRDAGFDPVLLDWPLVLTPYLMGQIRTFDWMVLDIGPASVTTGIVGYAHGAFVPSMRLLKVEESQPLQTPSALYSGVNVGYRKDIIRWSNLEMLQSEFAKRLDSLNLGTRRISTPSEASDYFLEASRRKEAVFVSYAGEDEAVSEDLRAALRKKFQQVFDYRDGKSISPGQPWISQIYDQLGKSAVCIPLLSSSYVSSGHCLHELRQIIALGDGGKIHVVPIKLRRGDDFKLPAEIQATQYARSWEYGSPDELVDWITTNLPVKAATT